MRPHARSRRVTLPPPGTILADRYQLLEPIGEGGMSTVYLAEHIAIGRKLAVKVLVPEFRDNKDLVDRFLQEARAVSLIRHEHIVDITDIGRTAEGLAFLAMEYLEGEDLSTTLLREGRLPWMRLRRMVLQICRALHAAHRKGVVHRDIKPENCFRIKRGGNRDFIKILDFGIAKLVAEEHSGRFGRLKTETGNNLMLGTPEYMAPELTRGETPGGAVDVYSLGALMYHALVGHPPFSAPTAAEVIAMQLRDDPKPLRSAAPDAEIPASIERIVLRALAKDPGDRFASVREMTEAIIRADARLSRVTQSQVPAIANDPRGPNIGNDRTASGAIELQDSDVVEIIDPDEIFDLRTRAHADEDTVILVNPLANKQTTPADDPRMPAMARQIRQLQLAVVGLICTCILFFVLGWVLARSQAPSQPIAVAPSAPALVAEATQPTAEPPKQANPAAQPTPPSEIGATEVAKASEAAPEPEPETQPATLEHLSRADKKALANTLKQPVLNCARFDHLKSGTKLNIKFTVATKTGEVRATVPPVYQGRMFEKCVDNAAKRTRSKRGHRSTIVWGRYRVP